MKIFYKITDKFFETMFDNIVLSVVLFCFLSCSNINGTEDKEYFENPFQLKASGEINLIVQERFTDFLSAYNIPDNYKGNFRFDPVTFYFESSHFNDYKPVIFNEEFNPENKEILEDRLIDFLFEWSDLFGSVNANFRVYSSEYYEEDKQFRINFRQYGIGGREVPFIDQPGIIFSIKETGELSGFWNTIFLNDYPEFPKECNMDKIMKSIIGHSINNMHSYNTFKINTGNLHKIRDGFEIHIERKETFYNMYFLKGIEVKDTGNSIWGFVIYCHPETGEIIYVKKKYYP
ncbi:hypothetical protein ACFL4T_00165 [candidate division KSB1 bacterium]